MQNMTGQPNRIDRQSISILKLLGPLFYIVPLRLVCGGGGQEPRRYF